MWSFNFIVLWSSFVRISHSSSVLVAFSTVLTLWVWFGCWWFLKDAVEHVNFNCTDTPLNIWNLMSIQRKNNRTLWYAQIAQSLEIAMQDSGVWSTAIHLPFLSPLLISFWIVDKKFLMHGVLLCNLNYRYCFYTSSSQPRSFMAQLHMFWVHFLYISIFPESGVTEILICLLYPWKFISLLLMHSTLGGKSEGGSHFHASCRSWKNSIGSSEEKGECYWEILRQTERN